MTKESTTSDMRRVFSVINEMTRDGIIENYAVGGAVAAIFYTEPTSTMDVDIFVTPKPYPGKAILSLQPIYDYLTAKGATVKGEHIVYAGWPLQFLPANSRLVEEALDGAREFDDDGVSIRVFSLEHLAAIALEVGRGKDKLRLDGFMSSGKMDLGKFRDILGRHGLVARYEDWQKWKQSI
jgi:hypothetical protein